MASSPQPRTERLAEVTHRAADAEYSDTCRLFNSAVDKRPEYVVRCRDSTDVTEAIAWARDSGLRLAVRSGGHSVSGASLCDGGVVLDVRGLNAVDVDPATRTVTVGGGAMTAEVDAALQAHGLATTLGNRRPRAWPVSRWEADRAGPSASSASPPTTCSRPPSSPPTATSCAPTTAPNLTCSGRCAAVAETSVSSRR